MLIQDHQHKFEEVIVIDVQKKITTLYFKMLTLIITISPSFHINENIAKSISQLL